MNNTNQRNISIAEKKIAIALENRDIHLRDLVQIDVEIQMQKNHLDKNIFAYKKDFKIAQAELYKLEHERDHKLKIIKAIENVCKSYIGEIRNSAANIKKPS